MALDDPCLNQRRSVVGVIIEPQYNNIIVVSSSPTSLISPPPPVGFFPSSSSSFVGVVVAVLNPSFRPPHHHHHHHHLVVPYNRPAVLLVHHPPPPVRGVAAFTLNPDFLIRNISMEEERTHSLFQFLEREGLVPSRVEEIKRKDVIAILKQVIMCWVRKVAWQRFLPKDQIFNTSAALLTYGSYGLGAHGSDSDIDALCIGPWFATMAEDFFIVLRKMLQSLEEVSEIHCVKGAKIPLMRFKFNGISIDLPYAQLKVASVPDNVDVVDPIFLTNIDETSWKCLSGVRANRRILQLVPNLEKFQLLLRCLKLWARKRGVYCYLVGFFGGIHITVLAAYVCQRYPNASVNALISKFFETFGFWPWPTPVMLEDGLPPMIGEHSFMPIQFPCGPHEFCRSNITKSTFQRIRTELLRGHAIIKNVLSPDFDWSSLFEPYSYTKVYKRFVRIFLAASNQDELGDWVGWVKSRFHSLLLKLEEVQGLCDPNPAEHVDPNEEQPNIVFYWGLQRGRSSFTDIKSIEDYFKQIINKGCSEGTCGRLELSIIESSQLPKNFEMEYGNKKESKGYWRILEPQKPIYSHYLPHYFVGFAGPNRVTEYTSVGD